MKIKLYISILTFFAAFSIAKAQTLDDYVTMAADSNPGLQAKYKEFEAAMQLVSQVNTLPDPVLSFGYFISPVETRVGPQQARLSLVQMFPWFGTLKTKGNVSTYNAEAKYQAFLDARNQLFYRVSAAYYPLYELTVWKQLEQENVDILESYKTIATKQFENGRGSLVDVLRVDLVLKDASTNLDILYNKERPLVSTFNALLNRSDTTYIALPDSIIIEQVFKDNPVDSLLMLNPTLKELDLKLSASQEAELAEHKQGLPQFGVGIDYGIVGKRTDADVPNNGKNILMPMVSMSIPIFRKKYKSSKRETQIMQEQYTLQKEDRFNMLIADFHTTRFEVEQQLRLLTLYDAQIEESQQVLNLLYTAYGNSGKEFEEVLRMQQLQLKYRKMKASALSQYQIAEAKLNYILAKQY